MPCIKTIDSIKIYIYARDHNPPHFHAIKSGIEELIIISDLSTYSGKLPKQQRKKVLKWAKDNREFLRTEWLKINKR